MKSALSNLIIVAGLIAASTTQAYTYSGFVSDIGEHGISPGMSAMEVLARLGSPASQARHGSGGGPSWSYSVFGASPGTRFFYVDFGPDNRVTSKGEYSIPSGG